MKAKFIALAAALATCSAASAQSLTAAVKPANGTALGKVDVQPLRAASNEGELPTTIITEQPAGELHQMYGSAQGYFTAGQNTILGANPDGEIKQVVVADNEVYIKNPLSTIHLGTWLKGEKKLASATGAPDTVVFQLPQAVLKVDTEDGSTNYLYLRSLSFVDKEDGGLGLEQNKDQRIKFTWDGDTLKKVGDAMIALTSAEGKWMIFGDDQVTITRQTDVPTTLPSTASEPQTYTMRHKRKNQWQTKMVRVARDGNDFYVGNLVDGNDDLWVKGTLQNGKVAFSLQYLGTTPSDPYYYKYFSPLKIDTVYDGNVAVDATYTLKSPLKFNYDATTGAFSTIHNIVINSGKHSFFATNDDIYSAPKFAPFANEPMTPQDPVITNVTTYNAAKGYGGVLFTLADTDASGKLLDPTQLSYKIYFDDEPYVFTTAKYPSLSENLTEIAYDFSDDNDFTSSGTERAVVILDEIMHNSQRLGVQAIYRGGNATRESKIVYQAIPSAVDGIAATKEVSSVVYTDLSGRQVSEPQGGLYLKTVRYTDGSSATTKVVK